MESAASNLPVTSTRELHNLSDVGSARPYAPRDAALRAGWPVDCAVPDAPRARPGHSDLRPSWYHHAPPRCRRAHPSPGKKRPMETARQQGHAILDSPWSMGALHNLDETAEALLEASHWRIMHGARAATQEICPTHAPTDEVADGATSVKRNTIAGERPATCIHHKRTLEVLGILPNGDVETKCMGTTCIPLVCINHRTEAQQWTSQWSALILGMKVHAFLSISGAWR